MFDMESDSVPALPSTPTTKKNKEEVAENKDYMKDAISTSPTDSVSSLDAAKADSASGPKGRRMSNVSDEERERARVYREGVMAGGGESPFSSLPGLDETKYGDRSDEDLSSRSTLPVPRPYALIPPRAQPSLKPKANFQVPSASPTLPVPPSESHPPLTGMDSPIWPVLLLPSTRLQHSRVSIHDFTPIWCRLPRREIR
jgi:hypothetical protein